MRSATALALAFMLPFAALDSPGQSQSPPQEDDTLKIGVELVQVDVVVTDKDGRRVEGLTPDDFEVYEDGKRQEISNFSFVKGIAAPVRATGAKRATGEPAPPARKLQDDDIRRVFALVVDDLFLSFEHVPWTKNALRKFVDEQMQEGDLVAVILTGKGSGALQQFTTDKRLLLASIDRIHFNMNGTKGPRAFTAYEQDLQNFSPLSRKPAEEKRVDDKPNAKLVDEGNEYRSQVAAVGTLGTLDYLVRSLEQLPGRKSLVWFSEGFSIFKPPAAATGGAKANVIEQMQKLVDRSNRAGVVIYPINTAGLVNPVYGGVNEDLGKPAKREADGFGDRRQSPETVMHYLANETGGFVYAGNEPAVGVERVVRDQESYYFIGYVPAKSSFEPENGTPKFHDIDIRVKRPDLRVRSRSGFLGYTGAPRAAATTPAARLAQAMSSALGSGGVELGLNAQYLLESQGKLVVRATMRVNAADLTFKDDGTGKMTSAFDVVAFTVGEPGVMEGIVYETKTMSVSAEELEKLRSTGLVFVMDLPIKTHGPYQVRAAVRDAATERIGSANEFVVVPNLAKSRLAVSGIALAGSTAKGFRPGSELAYAFAIYNVKVPQPFDRPSILTRISLWRDGKRLVQGEEESMQLAPQTSWARVNTVGRFVLSPKAAPGTYTLQIDVTDKNASKKNATTSQWVDFEVVPAD
jgi:VWFA-related protein